MAKSSFTRGSSVTEIIYRTLPSLLNQQKSQIPDKPAHIFRYPTKEQDVTKGRTVLTFGELAERSIVLAASLLDMGLEKGDRVTVTGYNCLEWLYLEYACMRIGVLLIKVPSNFTSAEEILNILQNTNSKVLIMDQETTLGILMKMLPNMLSPGKQCHDGNRLQFVQKFLLLRKSEGFDHFNLSSINDLVKTTPSAQTLNNVKAREESLSPDDIAYTLYTSGSTGTPKLILFSHYGIINNFIQEGIKCCAFAKNGRNQIIFNDRPFAWSGSYLLVPVIFGIPFVHIDPVLSLKGDAIEFIFDVLKEEKVTSAMLMPYMLHDLIQGTKSGKITIPSTLTNIWITGERIPKEIIEFVHATFDTVHIMYGSSELFCVGVSEMEKGRAYNSEHIFYKMYAHVEMKLNDEEGKIVALGEAGTVHIRSFYSMYGYTCDFETTFGKSPAGWIDMGDVARMREDGSFEIIGRTKDVISRGTVKIYPKSLENILIMNEKVEKVKVVGVPDPRFFQEVCACVVPKSGLSLTADELTKFFTEQTQANVLGFSPKYYLILDDFPIANTGKFDTKKLVSLAKEHFKLAC